MEIVALFCDIDDCWLQFEPAWHRRLRSEGSWQPPGRSRLCLSEVRTIVVSFPQSGDRTCKDYFLRYVTPHLSWAFPHVVSYPRFVELMQAALIPLCAYLPTRKGKSQGVAFIDSTLLAVCHPKRSARHKVFAGFAAWGKNSLGWTYGFKLHLLINDSGELVACCLTAANIDDRKPVPPAPQGAARKSLWGSGLYLPGALHHPLCTGGATHHQVAQRQEE